MKTKKIAVVGTHGTGKTTLTFEIAHHYKKLGNNVKIIQEVARSCPFPINEGMTKEAALWIYHEHSRKELEASDKHYMVITDRSVADSFFYAAHFKIDIDMNILRYAISSLESYDRLFFVRPDIPPQEDGVRSVDLEFQKSIDEIFKEILQEFDHIEIQSSQIFSLEKPWKQFCL